LSPDISFDDNVVGDKNIIEDGDDKAAAHNVVVAEVPPVVVAPVAQANGVLAPLPQNISGIAASRKKTASNSKSNDILEVYKLKILQKDEEREAKHECYEHECEDRAAEMRMCHEEEERRDRHEAEIRKAEAEAHREEMWAEAESHHEERLFTR
jgi:hypothetical protein